MVQFPPFDGAVIAKQVTHGSPCSTIPPVYCPYRLLATRCRVHVQHNSPRLLSVRPRFGAAWRPVEQSCTSVAPRRAVLRQWGSIGPVSERDTGGNGGGFAALEASPRRVAGVSRL